LNEVESMEAEMQQARMSLAKCKQCREVPEIGYEPGCTWIKCKCDGKALAVPDWSPDTAAHKWNANNEPKYAKFLRERYG